MEERRHMRGWKSCSSIWKAMSRWRSKALRNTFTIVAYDKPTSHSIVEVDHLNFLLETLDGVHNDVARSGWIGLRRYAPQPPILIYDRKRERLSC